MRLAYLLAAAACSTGARPTPPTGSAAPVGSALVPLDANRGAIPTATRELVTGVIDDWTSTAVTLQLWRRDSAPAAWRASGEPWPAVIGGSGAAWGDGLHGRGAPAGRSGPRKHEGDRTSPAGSFALRGVYGYAAVSPGGTMPYTPVDDHWQCVDDPHSTHYAQILDRSKSTVDWSSAEQMRRSDAAYTWVVDIAHNADRTAGDGSCIFLHVWHDAGTPTVGCTAMTEPRLATLITELDPAAAPVYVLLPRAEYRALAGPWGLPPLSSLETLTP